MWSLPRPPEATYVSRVQAGHYRDFDEFVASVQGIDCSMTLQNAARHSWDIEAAELPGTRVQLGRLGSGNIVEGQSLRDMYVIYLPLSDTCEYLASGVTIEKDAFAILEPGCDCCLSTKLEHDWCSIFIPADRLPAFSSPVEAEDAQGPMICRTTGPNRHLANRFRASVREVLNAASREPEFGSSIAAEVASTDLMELGAAIIQSHTTEERSDRFDGRPKITRREIVRAAQEALEEREHYSVRELVATTGVTERTLRRAFQEFFGVGPHRYLQLRSLHAIYRELRAAEPDETSVSRVLADHGAWEFGRVAGRYQQLFGELPSETLRRRSPS